MKKAILYFLILTLASCQYFEKQVPSEEELLEKQIKEINWKEVDEYPSFSNCDSLTDKNSRKQCFFEVMSSTIQQRISVDTLKTLFPKLDTIEVRVTILPNATIEFEPQFPNDAVAYDTIKVDSVLKARLLDFPKVNPAIKRGIPVKTQFILPVIIRAKTIREN